VAHADVSILRGLLTWQADAALTGPYGKDVASVGWLTVDELYVTRGIFGANGRVPRGPIKGCHVAPRFLVYWSFI
jgi:hypothetical protein